MNATDKCNIINNTIMNALDKCSIINKNIVSTTEHSSIKNYVVNIENIMNDSVVNDANDLTTTDNHNIIDSDALNVDAIDNIINVDTFLSSGKRCHLLLDENQTDNLKSSQESPDNASKSAHLFIRETPDSESSRRGV
eukprot:4348618-Ditylum_brightwellii.AAC.1